MRKTFPVFGWMLVMSAVWCDVASAETFTLTPEEQEGWTVLEAAQAGDVVEVAPGTYQYRVFLENQGTQDNPIIIRAQDPNDRPVWDLEGSASNLLGDAPGSYTAGDRHRGCWQVGPDGAHYVISGIVFRNCRDSASAGMRMVNSGPVTLRDCLFESNTNGLTGASEDLVVEFCEFRDNGKTFEGGNMTHNIYIYGGKFTMRYCYNHDSHEGQLFHIRAQESLLEYNWLARPSGYVGDVMTCEYLCGSDPFDQYMTLIGNVIIQGQPQNGSQILVLYRDEDNNVENMHMSLFHNTIIGTPRGAGRDHFLVHMVNDPIGTYAQFYNNIIYNVGQVTGVDFPEANNWGVEGSHNWITEGSDATGLTDTIIGTDPGFVDAAALDFMLVEGAPTRGQANSNTSHIPDREYYLNEIDAMQYRARASAEDLGAFEYVNDAAPIGPYEEPLQRDTDSGAATDTQTEDEATDTDQPTDTEQSSEQLIETDTRSAEAADTSVQDPPQSDSTPAATGNEETDSIGTGNDSDGDVAPRQSDEDTDVSITDWGSDGNNSSDSTGVRSTGVQQGSTDTGGPGQDTALEDGGTDDDAGDDDKGCSCRAVGHAKGYAVINLMRLVLGRTIR